MRILLFLLVGFFLFSLAGCKSEPKREIRTKKDYKDMVLKEVER